MRGQCVVFGCILLSSGLCGKNGALLVMPSQSVLLLVRQSVFQSNLSISVSYNSFSKVKKWREFFFKETEITLFTRVKLCQVTIQSKKPIYIEFLLPFTGQPCRKHDRFCYHFNICIFITSPIYR